VAVGDHNSKAKGNIGAVIVLIERKESRNEEGFFEIKNYKVGMIDGKLLKEDVFYKLEGGEFIEVKET
jgi:hypothetical protein